MTSRERAVKALKGEIPDRVPCVPLIDTSYAAAVANMPVGECFMNPEAYAYALVKTLERHPDIDGVSINIGLSSDIIQDASKRSGTWTVKTSGGLTWHVPENDIGSIGTCEITDLNDPRFATDEYLMKACLRTLQAIPESIRKKYLINTTVTGPYSQVAFLIGVNNLMMATIDDPDGLDKAIALRVPFALKRASRADASLSVAAVASDVTRPPRAWMPWSGHARILVNTIKVHQTKKEREMSITQKITTSRTFIKRSLLAMAMLTLAISTQATPLTWNGPVNGNWDTATSNWLDGATPATWNNGNPDSAVFGATGAGTINVAESITTLALTFNVAGYTLTNKTLTLSAGAIITANAAATINNTLAGTGGMVKTGTGTLTLGGNNTFTGGATISSGTLQLNNTAALNSATPNAIVLGVGGASNPTLLINGGQTTLGALTVPADVTDATISMTQNSGTWSHTINGATLSSPLNINQSNATSPRWSQISWKAKITGSGGGAGNDTLIFNNTSSMQNYFTTDAGVVHDFVGNVHSKAGVIAVQTGNAGGNLTIPDTSMLWIESGEWRWNTGSMVETIDGLRGAGTMGNPGNVTLTINASNSSNEGNRIFSGTVGAMKGPLTKTGTGTQELSGASIAISQAVNLNQGTLKLTKTTAWNSTIAFHASNVATLQLNAPLSADSWTFSRQITGGSANAKIEKVGLGTMLLSPAASSSFIGSSSDALTVTEGKLYLNATGFTTAPAVSIAAGTTFGGTATAGNITVANNGILEGGYNSAGTLSAGNVTLGSTSTDTATLKATLSSTSGYKAFSVNNLTLNGGDQSVLLDVTGLGLTSGTYYDLLVSANAITAPNASSVLAALKANSRVYTPILANEGKTIQVYYDAAASIYWTGESGTAWNTATSNWRLNGNNALTPFLANDVVFFNDSPSSLTVDISNGNVAPVSTTFNNTTATAYTLQGANGISSGFIIKNGNGTVTINNANTTVGSVALNEGTLSLSQGTGLGTGSLNFNGGTLEYTGTAGSWSRLVDVTTNGGTIKVATGTSLTSGGSLTGAGILTKSGPGTLVLPYTSGTITTPVKIDDGTLTLNYGGGNPTYSGQISGSNGILRLEGTGVSRDIGLTLTTNNTFIGETHIYGRRIFLNSPTGNAIGGDIVSKQSIWPYHDLTINANEQIADTAVLRFEHTGDVYEFRLNGKTETLAGISNKDGSPGIIENAGYDNDGGNDNNMPPGTLNVTGNGRYVYKTCIRNQNGGSGNGALSFGKSGVGTQELWNVDIYYTGTTTVNDGLLVLQDTTAFNSSGVIMNGGDLELKRTTGTWTYNKAIIAGTGAGNLVKSGAGVVTLSGTNTYTGTTTVNAGTLVLQEAPNFASSEIILNGGTFELSRTNGVWTYNNAISAGTGAGNFVKSGNGTVVLGGANTYTGTTTINGGTLLVNGSNSGSGAFSVASGATLGGSGSLSGVATFNTGAKAVFTVTLDPVTKTNTTPLTIAGVMTFNATEVHVNAPEQLPVGRYVLAASSAAPSGSLTETPVLDSGSYGANFSSAAVYLDTVNNALMLSVRPRNTLISFF